MIDAHVHLWRLGFNGCTWPTADLRAIHRDFTIDDLIALPVPGSVEQFILVQSQESSADTDWLLSIAGHPRIAGVVGWVDFCKADAVTALERLASDDRLRGVRPMVQDRESDWYDAAELDPAFAAMAGLQLVLDALVRPRHLASLFRLGLRHRDLNIIIDHAGKPAPGDLVSWSEQMAKLAHLPNVSCKLSGLLTELPPGEAPQAVDLLIQQLWKLFGAERLIWGSDWPVLTLAGNYCSWLEQCQRLVPIAHHDAVFESNARRVYGIPGMKAPCSLSNAVGLA